MTILTNSRYLGEDQVLVEVRDGERCFAIYPAPFVAPPTKCVDHIVAEGETFDTIADRVFGDPTLWWVVARLNPHVFYPASIPPGTFIRTPVP